MSIDARERLERRVAELSANDPQFAAARPDPAVSSAINDAGQGEFVTITKLEATFGNSPLVRQIYVYGNSIHPYLLAVVVPTEDALGRYNDPATLKALIAESLQKVAKEANLQSYEVPRDFIVETVLFSLQEAKIGPDKDIPHVSAPIIVKSVTDLQQHRLL